MVKEILLGPRPLYRFINKGSGTNNNDLWPKVFHGVLHFHCTFHFQKFDSILKSGR